MAYCQHCGSEVDHEVNPVEQAARDQVEIARINAERDVAIARLQARMQREELDTVETVTETESDAQVAAAEVEAEIIAAAIESTSTDEAAPLVIEDPGPVEEPADEMTPPEVDEHEHHEGRKRVGLGLW